MTPRAAGLAGAFGLAAVIAVSLSVASCQQPVQTIAPGALQLPQKTDVVCLQVNDAVTGAALPAPVLHATDDCQPPASTNTNPAGLALHLFALVTQSRRGELGVVDLTAGNVVDVDQSTPGVDFVPVGANPTDIVVSPDGAFTFVTSADPQKWALDAVDNTRILGDSTVLASSKVAVPPQLTDIRACALPEPPQAVAVLPATSTDGGAPSSGYVLAVLLRPSGGVPAQIETIAFDPGAIPPGSLVACPVLGTLALSSAPSAVPAPGPTWPDGVPYADAEGPDPLPSLGPTCSAGADASAPAPAPSGDADAGGTPDAGAQDDAADDADGGNESGPSEDASGSADAGPDDAPNEADALMQGSAPPVLNEPSQQAPSMVLRSDVPIAYVSDGSLPVIHVLDLHDASHPVELEPLLATSALTPGHVSVGSMAISPPTRDFKTYLYAIDTASGTIMVYDVTDPVASPHVPLMRPHAELTPLVAPDRITFTAPVVSVAFAQHDWPLEPPNEPGHTYTGLLCNPNPNAHPSPTVFTDRGAYYRADQDSVIQSMDSLAGTVTSFPTRLRGVFGFAALSTGQVITIDVDDWDAPCRRPDWMTANNRTGLLDLPEPDAGGPDDLDPYHAPTTFAPAVGDSPGVTLEQFFPVSAPHRPRSSTLLRSDATVGQRLPTVQSAPQLFSSTGAAVASSGATGSPLMLPTPLNPGFADPTYLQNPSDVSATGPLYSPAALGTAGADDQSSAFAGCGQGSAGCTAPAAPPSLRVSFDDPTAHVDQDWTVTYEGQLPTVNNVAADLSTDDNYQTLLLSAPGAHFCADGVEDWNVGQARAHELLAEMSRAFGGSPPTGLAESTLPSWTTDYVEIADDLLVSTDPQWQADDECWDPSLRGTSATVAQARQTFCENTFGDAVDADTHLLRDFPIISAHDETLRVSCFDPPCGPIAQANPNVVEQTTNRVVNPPSPANASLFRAVRCCFHHQATFKVRAGGEWLALGSVVGMLHHVVADASGACVVSCDPRQALVNSRAFDVPWATLPAGAGACTPAALPSFDRNSPMAFRNPMFSFVVWSGCGPPTTPIDHTLTARDLSWHFTMAGSFTPLTVSILSQTSGTAVSPQSMRYIAPFGNLAVVDGEAQGLVLIDLNLMAVIHNYP